MVKLLQQENQFDVSIINCTGSMRTADQHFGILKPDAFYRLELVNQRPIRAICEVKIDEHAVGSWILQPHQKITIAQPLEPNGLSPFKFQLDHDQLSIGVSCTFVAELVPNAATPKPSDWRRLPYSLPCNGGQFSSRTTSSSWRRSCAANGYSNVQEAPVHKSGNPIEPDESTRSVISFQLVPNMEAAQALSKLKTHAGSQYVDSTNNATRTSHAEGSTGKEAAVEEASTEEEGPAVVTPSSRNEWRQQCAVNGYVNTHTGTDAQQGQQITVQTPLNSQQVNEPTEPEARVQAMCDQHGVEFEIRNGVASSPSEPASIKVPIECCEAMVQTLVDMGFSDRSLCTQMVNVHKDIKKCVKALIEHERQQHNQPGGPEHNFPWQVELTSMVTELGFLDQEEHLCKIALIKVQGNVKQAVREVMKQIRSQKPSIQ
jgi:hypothetical protein